MKSATKTSLHLAFDVGHSSIGWAVLEARIDKSPVLLGSGVVIFPADDCLASQRRLFRRQRRHIRATRLRIARMKRLLAHLGVLTNEQLDAPGCAWPWLLAARVLRGGKKLTWAELWDVLRWYAHNRGYDGNKGWSRQDAAANAEDTEKEQKAHELLDAFRAKHGREGTMAEVFCERLGLDPLAEKKASQVRFRDLGAAFPREGVEAEVERILRAQGVEEKVIVALMRDHTAVAGPEYRLPARYGQRVGGARTPGGLLFGQLVPRFENRIIATCPVQFQREYERALAEGKDAKQATEEAEKRAKVPGIGCVEFHRYRWAMQLANVTVATGDARKTRRLTKEERTALNAEMEKAGALTPGEFKKAVRTRTGTNKDNLDRLLALPDADKSLVLDPARKLAAGGVLGVLWPHLGASLQKHTLTNLRRGKAGRLARSWKSAPPRKGRSITGGMARR
jgi:CRISPR-associated endonuclease Csn1